MGEFWSWKTAGIILVFTILVAMPTGSEPPPSIGSILGTGVGFTALTFGGWLIYRRVTSGRDSDTERPAAE